MQGVEEKGQQGVGQVEEVSAGAEGLSAVCPTAAPAAGLEEVPPPILDTLGYPPQTPEGSWAEVEEELAPVRRRLLSGRKRGKRLVKAEEKKRKVYKPEERLLILDTWHRSALPAKDFGTLVGVSPHTLYKWKKAFEESGPAGLMDTPKGPARGSRLPEITKRTILMLKENHPEYGCQRISDMLARGPALGASASAVARVLHEAGYVLEERVTRPHKDKVRRFERARPNQMWQTDMFTFVLKRQNRRVHMVAFLDDHSRFVVGYGLHATASTALVLEVFESAIASYQAPEEILTDNGSQYVTWRGKSKFSRLCERRGIKQVVARPRHPRTLGKVERFWGTLWRECLDTAIFRDLNDARERIGQFIDHYNFQRVHRGIEGLVPADRYFGVGSEVLASMKARVKENALAIAQNGIPKKQVYLAGQIDGKPFSLHTANDRVYLREGGQKSEEVDFASSEDSPHAPHGAPPDSPATADLPGVTTLEDGLQEIAASFSKDETHG